MHNEWIEKTIIVKQQLLETVKQEADDITIRMATITCPCGWKRSVVKMYQCLYCKIWFCHLCAEIHFGKTVKKYLKEKHLKEKTKRKQMNSLLQLGL